MTTLTSEAIRWRNAFRQPNFQCHPHALGTNDWKLLDMQHSIIEEEFEEFSEAYCLDFPESEQLKELADLVFTAAQFAAARGWDLDEALRRVTESNFSKLDDNGQPLFREDGKILKGPNYQPPDLTDLV
jgi:predicted HAD superfamily Cof-like phosphohydrolase